MIKKPLKSMTYVDLFTNSSIFFNLFEFMNHFKKNRKYFFKPRNKWNFIG